MNTAHYRTLAAEYESSFQWQQAAETWQKAIDAYRKHVGSALSRADLAMMAERRDTCRTAAEAEMREAVEAFDDPDWRA